MEFPFSGHIALLEQFLCSRPAIVDGLERHLFSARGKANAENADRESIAAVFTDCFFESPAISRDLSRLNGQLDVAHLADGFEPARQDGYARGLDPVELVLRACHHWNSSRWPGRNSRLVFAQSLYALFVLHQLELLSLRIWDADRQSSIVDRPLARRSAEREGGSDNDPAAERLRDVQRLLDVLNEGGPSTQLGAGRAAPAIRIVRDARWLIQTAQGPLTRHLKPYFIMAGRVSGLNDARLEIHKAGAVLAGGHLRSQLRHLSRRTGWAFDDPRLLALTRSSNSMDMALLVHDLVPLLDAYAAACVRHDADARLALADAIVQGLSADPELLLTRLDLLAPSTMIEELFLDRSSAASAFALRSHIVTADKAPGYTAMGELHRECLARYGELVGRTAESLRQDSRAFDPVHAAYSPLGIVYGFCSDLFSNMVLNTLRAPSSSDLSLEDLFISQGRLQEKRTLADEWTRLPKRDGERDPFEHSTEWAWQMYARLRSALEARAARPDTPNASTFRTSHLYVVPRDLSAGSLSGDVLPAGIVRSQEHCLTTDATRARETGATLLSADRMAADRSDGRFLACSNADGAWFGISKVLLTLCTSQEKDALITDVPRDVVDLLRVTCPHLLVVTDRIDPDSSPCPRL